MSDNQGNGQVFGESRTTFRVDVRYEPTSMVVYSQVFDSERKATEFAILLREDVYAAVTHVVEKVVWCSDVGRFHPQATQVSVSPTASSEVARRILYEFEVSGVPGKTGARVWSGTHQNLDDAIRRLEDYMRVDCPPGTKGTIRNAVEVYTYTVPTVREYD